MELKTLWSRIKGAFLIAGAVAIAAKGTAALPAEHLVQVEQNQKKQDLKEKQEAIEKHRTIYPCQKKCLPHTSFNKIHSR